MSEESAVIPAPVENHGLTKSKLSLAEKQARMQRANEFRPEKGKPNRPQRDSMYLVRKVLLRKNNNGKTNWECVLMKIYDTALNTKSPFQIQAAEFLATRAWGKAKMADSDAEAIAKGGLQLVFVQRPELPPDAVQPLLQEDNPSFIEGEVVGE